MYTLLEVEDSTKEYIILSNSDSSSIVKICLDEGGRLTRFSFNNTEVIADEEPSNYKENFASAILFPFTNRIKNGKYVFDNVQYELVCNEKVKTNAIHGLVYDKTFSFLNKEIHSDFARITLAYNENDGCDGFPFKYSIKLEYTLNNSGLFLKVIVKNEDIKPFPFTLGWHPYFLSSNLDKSKLSFNSTEKLISDNHGIVIGKEQMLENMPLALKGRKFDDAYHLQSDMVSFITPNYQLQLKSSALNNYLQIFTPDSKKVIAIEPMTGVSNSFNNNIGKQVLNPEEDFLIEWQMKITNFNTQNIISNTLKNKLCNS